MPSRSSLRRASSSAQVCILNCSSQYIHNLVVGILFWVSMLPEKAVLEAVVELTDRDTRIKDSNVCGKLNRYVRGIRLESVRDNQKRHSTAEAVVIPPLPPFLLVLPSRWHPEEIARRWIIVRSRR